MFRINLRNNHRYIRCKTVCTVIRNSDNTKELDKYRRTVAQAEAALSKTERELGKTEEALEDVRRPTNRAADAFEKLKSAASSLVPSLSSVGGALKVAGMASAASPRSALPALRPSPA